MCIRDRPKSNSTTVAPSDLIVMMTKSGDLSFNGKPVSKSQLKNKIKATVAKMSNKENASVAIVAEVGVPWKKINDAMQIANQLRLKTHIATQPLN